MDIRELTTEEAEALTKDLQEVLEKHDAEMQTKTTIELVKRIDNGKETHNQPAPEESSQSDPGQPS